MSYNRNVLLFMYLSLFVFSGCTPEMRKLLSDAGINIPGPETEEQEPAPKVQKQKQKQKQRYDGDDPARKFMEIHDLGRQITSQTGFDDFLAILPNYFINNTSKSRVYLTRIDFITA